VSPHSKIAATRLSTIEEFNSSSNPKKRIRKLITEKETE
jgi:hypothetical protein